MSSAKRISVKESLSEIKLLLKSVSSFLVPRVRVLLALKKHEGTGISKRALAELVGVSNNSVQTWRSLYSSGGIDALLSHKKTGYKPSVISAKVHVALKDKLNNPTNGLSGYKDLQHWVREHFESDINYNTLLAYCKRHFGTKIKVARKSHVKKDDQAVDAFKKTLVSSVAMPASSLANNMTL
jgi:transposase